MEFWSDGFILLQTGLEFSVEPIHFFPNKTMLQPGNCNGQFSSILEAKLGIT